MTYKTFISETVSAMAHPTGATAPRPRARPSRKARVSSCSLPFIVTTLHSISSFRASNCVARMTKDGAVVGDQDR